MTPAVPDLRPRKPSVAKRASAASERTKSTASQAAGVIPRWLSGWRGELVLLALVLVGVAIFFGGYGVGMRDNTFRTEWYSPLHGTSAAPLAVGSVQGGPIDRSGNTPLLVTLRGLRILPAGAAYTEFYWTVNARSLMNFLSLRNAETAQREIRRYAEVVESLLAERMPITHAAFVAAGRTPP